MSLLQDKDFIEIRLKFLGDYRNWEDTPVAAIWRNGCDVQRDVYELSIHLSQLAKVRWNVKGSSQGHYVNVR